MPDNTVIVFQLHHLGDFGLDGDRATCGEHSGHRHLRTVLRLPWYA